MCEARRLFRQDAAVELQSTVRDVSERGDVVSMARTLCGAELVCRGWDGPKARLNPRPFWTAVLDSGATVGQDNLAPVARPVVAP